MLKLKPTKAFAAAVSRLVDHILEICRSEKDDDWFAKQREMEVEYFRYDGCDRRGCDVGGAVARGHAMKRDREEDAEEGSEEASEDEESDEAESD